MKIFVKSGVRIRPFITTDQPSDVVCVNALPHLNQVIVSGQSCFTVDYALAVNFTQSQVFEGSVLPMVSYFLQGYDVSVVVYGQANSGKTYTIFGPGFHCAFSEADYGIIPRATREIFNQLMRGTKRYKVTISFIEIFGDSIRDLLGNNQIKPVLEEKNGRTTVCHVNEVECHSVSEVFSWLHIGTSSRQASQQALNAQSSRTHSVFTLFLEQEWISDGIQQKVHSQAQFTDLAGSNSMFVNSVGVETSGVPRLHYDNSLHALENMIVALSDPSSEHAAIFHMNTVLTRLLKNCCGGTACTLFICCVSPMFMDIRETLHSLQLAVQVRNVKNFLALHVTANTSTMCSDSPGKESAEEVTTLPENLNGDMFGLSFAASQWLKLVASAENLFSELATSSVLNSEMKDQIEHWLCLKQECEECIESDHGASDSNVEARLLYRIDELTEPEERNSSVVEAAQSVSSHCGSSGAIRKSLLDSNIGFPDFSEKLDGCIKLFRNQTDNSVEMVEEKFVVENCSVQDSNLTGDSLQKNSLQNPQEKNEEEPEQCASEPESRQGTPPKHLASRRSSICHAADSPFVLVSKLKLAELNELQELPETEEKEVDATKDCAEEPTTPPPTDLSNMLMSLKQLTAESDNKPSKLEQVVVKLEESLKGIEELKKCMWMKEQLIGNLIKNELRMSLKHVLLQNSNKLCSEFLGIKSHICDENCVSHIDVDKNKCEQLQESEDKDLSVLSQLYEECLKEVGQPEGATKTSSSNDQMTEIKKLLQKEVEKKHELEKVIAADKEKIKELQERYHMQEMQMAENNPGKQLQWIQEEETRLMNIQKSALHLHEELLKQQNLIEKREAFLKKKLCKEKFAAKDDTDMNARMPHFAHILKERTDHLEPADDEDAMQSLRNEIHNLRKTRESLVEQLCSLDETFQQDKILTSFDERKLIECDEAIAAIDAAIEYKNQLLCGQKDFEIFDFDKSDKNEELLLARLMKLSPVEIRSLLCLYFKKVIDLREGGRKMEMQLAELDIQSDAQNWKIQALTGALHQARADAEREVLNLRKEHEHKLQLMLRRFAEDSSSGSELEPARRHYASDVLANLDKYKHENKNLRKRVQEMEAVINTSDMAGDVSSSSSPVMIPHQNLKQLQGTLAPYTTKVTRQKNKLIIQQQAKKHNQKR